MIRKPSFRIFLIVYGGLTILSAYLIGSNYLSHLKQAEESTLGKLYGIASTLSQQIDRDAVASVFERFPFNGDTAGVSNEPVLQMYTALFRDAVEINQLKTPIYTLTYDSVLGGYFGGIASSGTQTYGWHYTSPPKKLHEVYLTGGTIPPFSDDHGIWLSAVYPLKNKQGKVFAVIEADYPFDSFIEEARTEAAGSLLVSILVMMVVGAVTYPALRQILNAEEKAKQDVEVAKNRLQEKSDEVVSSLEYARSIQETMLPSEEELNRFFGRCLVFNRPRDIVSGDFYWFHQLDEARAIIAVADCTGHGVPGAIMSMMGHNYLNEAILEQKLVAPSEILEFLDTKINLTFGSENTSDKGTDGMDIGICLVKKTEASITFAGARRPLTIVGNSSNETVSGTRRGIGERYLSCDFPFEDSIVPIQEDKMYFLYSDGLQDQFGGNQSRKLLRKRLMPWLEVVSLLPEKEQETKLQSLYDNWRGTNPQVDDICLVGFKL